MLAVGGQFSYLSTGIRMLCLETAAALPSARRGKALRRPRGGDGRAYLGGRPPTACSNYLRQGGYVFAFVCLSVCRITQKVVDEF